MKKTHPALHYCKEKQWQTDAILGKFQRAYIACKSWNFWFDSLIKKHCYRKCYKVLFYFCHLGSSKQQYAQYFKSADKEERWDSKGESQGWKCPSEASTDLYWVWCYHYTKGDSSRCQKPPYQTLPIPIAGLVWHIILPSASMLKY